MTQGVLIKSPLTLNNDEVAKPVILYKNHGKFGQFYSRKTDHSKRCVQAKLDGGIEFQHFYLFCRYPQRKKKKKRALSTSDLFFYMK